MRRSRLRYLVPALLALSLVGASLAIGASFAPKQKQAVKHDSGKNSFTAELNGHNEAPAVHTNGTGRLTLKVADDQASFAYTLTYSGLNSTPVLFAHVHVAQPNVNGGVSFFLCGGGGKPACPNDTNAAAVTGTITAADVLGITAQGMPAGNLAAILEEIREGFAYANVHTQQSPNGEIRGQLGSSRFNGFHKRGHDDDDD